MHHEQVLEGFGVRLEPLHPRHAPELASLVDPSLWAWMTTPYPSDEVSMRRYAESMMVRPETLAFAVLDAHTGELRGSTSLYDLVPSQGRVEIGSTFYGRKFWGTLTNPACKLLLLRLAFDELELYRVALRCDARNQRSIDAIRRLGATDEGKLRSHRVAPDGSRGDSMYFSILLPEWPDIEANLLRRLNHATP
jgi:RimJ/RimL family protein N-acetyltransferase